MNTLPSPGLVLWFTSSPERRAANVRQPISWLLLAANIFLGVLLGRSNLSAADGAAPGSVVVLVSSVRTHNRLQGATVIIPQLNRLGVTDSTGELVLGDLPPGPVDIVVSYTGFDPSHQTLQVSSGGRARAEVGLVPQGENEQLTEEVVKMSKFTVASELQGDALAITTRRNTVNDIQAVAMDSFGILPGVGVGDIIMRLPGVTYVNDSEDNKGSVLIRGEPSNFTRMTIDGLPLAGIADRGPALHSFSGSLYEQVQIIRGQVPDKSAEAIGGMINLVTRSAMTMNGRESFNYNVGFRWAPPFVAANADRHRHSLQGQTYLNYMQKLDAFGGTQNFGVALNIYYGENFNSRVQTGYGYDTTSVLPAFVKSFTSQSYSNNRHVTSSNLRIDYVRSDTTKFNLILGYNIGDEPAIDYATLTASASAAALSGFTASSTSTNAVAGSSVNLQTNHYGFVSHSPSAKVGVAHDTGHLKLNLNAIYSVTDYNQTSGQENGQQTAGASPASISIGAVGWRLTYADPEHPSFVQTAGPSIYDVGNYLPATMAARYTDNYKMVGAVEGDAAYSLDTAFPLILKSGLSFRQNRQQIHSWPLNASFVGNNNQLPVGFSIPIDLARQMGVTYPFLDPRGVYQQVINRTPGWTINDYANVQGSYVGYPGNNHADEVIKAGYLMAIGRSANHKLEVIAGARYEGNDFHGSSYIRTQKLATAAEIPDPVARAIHDYANPIRNQRSFSDWFPSIHASYALAENLKARASWSTSYGKPDFASLVPGGLTGASVNDTAQTISVNNADLRAEYSRNINVSLDYYLQPSGLLNVSYFTQNIRDFFGPVTGGVVATGPDNGFGGQYAGYTIATTKNLGSGKIEGVEAGYRQRFSFLPNPWKGLQLGGSYTTLSANGNFGKTSNVTSGQLAGFIPKSYNADVGYDYGMFGARVLMNYRGGWINTFSPDPSQQVRTQPRKIWTLEGTVRLRPNLSLFITVDNVSNSLDVQYIYVPSMPTVIRRYGASVTFGVSGVF